MKLGMIVACDLNRVIGINGDLPWHNKTDLRRFKHLTKGHTVIMGRKTYESLPASKSGEKLPGRRKVVMSKSLKEEKENTFFVRSSAEAYNKAAENLCELAWVIGGSSIYNMFIKSTDIDVIDLTIFNTKTKTLDTDDVTVLSEIPVTYKVVAEYQNPEDTLLWHRRYEMRHP